MRNLFGWLNFPSFLFGAIVATVIWWILALLRPTFQQLLESMRQQQRDRALQGSSNLENMYRKIVFRQTQGTHLAASLFALDEIAQETRLLAPPSYAEPHAPRPHIDITEQALPYMPDYPEFAAVYQGATLTIPEAISGGVNIIITGQPGTGKTTALAHLASQIVNRRPEVESLHEMIPIFIHAADLGLPLKDPKKPVDFLTPISSKLFELSGALTAGKLPGFVEYAFQSGRALLLLDGCDELTPTGLQEVTAYLRVILRQFPRARIVTTGTPDYVDGLLALGFVPMAIMPWTARQQREFLQVWTMLWQKYVTPEAWAQAAVTPVDPILLNRWLLEDNLGLTPLELTLKVWGAYAGDARGARPTDAIEAHLRRLLPPQAPIEALYVIGAQASLNGLALFETGRAREWTKSFEPAESPAPTETGTPPSEENPPEAQATPGATGPLGGKKQAAPPPRPASLVSQMTVSGILAAHGGSLVRFAHPIYLGFLAGKGLNAADAESVLKQPPWVGRTATLRYVAAFGDATGLVNTLLAAEDNLLLRPRLTAGRLLRDAPPKAPWRNTVMGALIQILQDEDHPAALRGQAMAAFALSGDPNSRALFRQLMMSPSNELRRLAALGAGLTRDSKSVDALIEVLANSAGAARQAACLALVEIGTPQALEAIANALLIGDEQLRIAAAEALANNPVEGYETLKDGVNSQDILVRRAIVYGLARVREPWAQELLGQIPTQDEQWVVRNAAVEMLEALQRPNPHIPQRQLSPENMPWLIEFAAKYGMGVVPGEPATDLLLLALKDENIEYKQAALHYLRHTPTEGVLAALYPHLFGSDPEMKDGVFRVLSEMAMGGTRLPAPQQFGLG
jgi:DNA polymerase III delta prime subunit